ncbi:MAG: acyl-CoA dehydrogenase family protein [Myxococcales bacterium]|jgi:acyl-CoA dehydrogenase family protein 9|nr:acyl-CoA dehydrogenase family protein [Myxococcales bacterium]
MADASFAKSLFFGVIAEETIVPYPVIARVEQDRTMALLDKTRKLCDREVDSRAIDERGAIPEALVAGFRDLGLFGLSIPAGHGGGGFSVSAQARVVEELAEIDSAVATMLGGHLSIGTAGPMLFGKDELRARLLPRMARGEVIGAFALTEPGAGSDAAGIQTRAEPTADGYVLNGTKSWVTSGDVAGLYTVFARTSPPEEDAKPKITAFAVERTGAVVPGKSEPKLGIRGSWSGDVRLVGAAVPAGNVLGEIGKGFKVAMELLIRGRLILAGSCIGSCKRLVKHAVDRCRTRKAFARPIGEFGLIKDKIALMMAETYALESAVYLTTGMVDRGVEDFSVESAICKVLGSEVLLRTAHEALQIAGAQGYMSSQPYERILRDARVLPIFQGTNEILRCFIALSGMQGPGREISEVSRALREPVKGFGLLSDFALRKARSALGRERFGRAHPVLAREAVMVEEYAQDLARSVDKVMRKHGHNIAEMQYTQRRVADMVIDLFATSAVIARTTQAIQKKGEEGSRREIDLTAIFAASAEKRLAEQVRSFDKNDDELRKAAAARAYVDGAYPLDVLGI